MANTYTQLYVHLVFAVRGRQSVIPRSHQEELNKYITGILRNRKLKMLAVGGMPDHIHIFFELLPEYSLSDIVRDIKVSTNKFINEKNWFPGKFQWQEGYGAFSYSRSHLDKVIRYVRDQEIHHHKTTFKEEYLKMLKNFEVTYDEKYLFEWLV